MDLILDDENNKENNKQKEEINQERSEIYIEGAKYPLSIYTRRVMNISKIDEYLKENSSRGQIGGVNLGNTCFMNSAIACLSNCTELTYYFLKGEYKKDLNEQSYLGMYGALAKSWAELLHQYWVEDTKEGNPSDFKNTIGQKAFIFSGNEQQDSNEFINTFLDYLNEDLNSVTKKEYIEMKEKENNESDIDCAKRFWECHLKRNNSIITDLFSGQFKSTVTCPDCGHINITFDPFNTINLPLLKKSNNVPPQNVNNENMEVFKFFYIPKYNLRNAYCISIKNIEKSKTLKDVIERIKKEEKFIYHDKFDKSEEIFLLDMLRKEKWSYPKKEEVINTYDFNEEYVYSFNFNEKEDEVHLPVYFWERHDEKSRSEYTRMIFGKKDMSLDNLRKNLYFYLRRYILSPLLKENEEKDNITLEIEKYINDKKLELNEEKLLELIEKEYQEVFKSDKSQDNKELSNFILNLPFKIFIQEERNSYEDRRIPFIDKENFNKLPNKFIETLNAKSFEGTLDELRIDIRKDYEIIVEFNLNSKYINKKTFKLNYFDKYVLDFNDIEKEEPKKEEEVKNKEEMKMEEEEDDERMTLKNCLKKFCKEEQLEEGDEWYCPKCKKHIRAKKKLELYYLPKILIICFKRFMKESGFWSKNDDYVEFPINDLDMKDSMIGPDKEHSKYDLFAVSQHFGSIGYGHYKAVCKNNGKWFSYDDSVCSETNETEALTSAAYVLFYRRQTD